MKQYKKVMGILLAGVLALSMAGCGDSEKTDGKAETKAEEGAGVQAASGADEEYAVIMSVNQLEFFDALKPVLMMRHTVWAPNGTMQDHRIWHRIKWRKQSIRQ